MSDDLSRAKPDFMAPSLREDSPEPLDGLLEAVGPFPVPEQEDAPFDGEAEVSVRRGRSRAAAAIREVAETLLLALLIYLTVRAVVQNFKVEGSSMDPTLHHGQYLLVNKAAYFSLDVGPIADMLSVGSRSEDTDFRPFGAPRRGDIVVFHFPRDPSRDFIKRVVALPGETVEIRSGVVYVNGQQMEEPYLLANPTYTRNPTVLSSGDYFVLGDNRSNSSDSHVWGPVPLENIVGKAWLSYWPSESWGSVSDHSVLADDG